jgi:hypothetical protein
VRIELTSQPLNEAIAKLERIAALYERIGAAQGTVAAGPTRGGGGGGGTVRGGGGGGRVVSGRSTVGGRGGGGGLVENLMRSNPGLTREQASAMAGNLPEEAARAETAAGPTRESAWERTQRAIRTSSAIQAARAQARTQSLQETAARNEQKRIERFERISNQTSSGRGTGIGGGPGGAGRPFFRERMRLAGTGLVAGVGGPWALGAAAVYGFVTAVRGAVESVNELHKAALITGGSMEEVARLQAMGVKATEANALRARMGSDPFAIMSMGFMPDPRIGGPQNNTPFVQNAILKLRRLRGNPDAQLKLARQMGAGEDIIAAANLGDRSFRYAQQTAEGAPSRKEAQDLADTQSDIKNFGQRLENRAVGFWSRFSDWSDRAQDFVRGHLGLPLFPHGEGAAAGKGPDSLQGAMDRQTQATQELISTMKQTQRDFYGRGMQDRGALPNAIFGADLLKGMRANRIRLGAFR